MEEGDKEECEEEKDKDRVRMTRELLREVVQEAQGMDHQ